jgi:hypothetical protein
MDQFLYQYLMIVVLDSSIGNGHGMTKMAVEGGGVGAS